MPKDFDMCVAEGGEVRTMKVAGGKYMHICMDKTGKWHKGEMKMPKVKNPKVATKINGGK